MSWIIRTRNGDTGSSLCLTVALATSAEAQREIPHLFTPREPQAPPRRSRQSNPLTPARWVSRRPRAFSRGNGIAPALNPSYSCTITIPSCLSETGVWIPNRGQFAWSIDMRTGFRGLRYGLIAISALYGACIPRPAISQLAADFDVVEATIDSIHAAMRSGGLSCTSSCKPTSIVLQRTIRRGQN